MESKKGPWDAASERMTALGNSWLAGLGRRKSKTSHRYLAWGGTEAHRGQVTCSKLHSSHYMSLPLFFSLIECTFCQELRILGWDLVYTFGLLNFELSFQPKEYHYSYWRLLKNVIKNETGDSTWNNTFPKLTYHFGPHPILNSNVRNASLSFHGGTKSLFPIWRMNFKSAVKIPQRKI